MARLWLLWPSFNAAVAGSPEAENMAVANTFVSLCGSRGGPTPRSALATSNAIEYVTNYLEVLSTP